MPRGLAARFASSPSREPGHPRAYGPDLLRAVAILLVMAWHLPRPARVGVLADIQSFGWIGVDIFFVLSGYLIGAQLLKTVAAGRSIELPRFWASRALRILPAFLVVLALYYLLPGFSDGAVLKPLWRFLTFTMNLDLDYRVTGAFTSAWSLCVEEHFYWVLPLLVIAVRRSKSAAPALLLLTAAVLLGGMALRWALWRGPAMNPETPPADFLRLIYYPTWCRLDGLALGVLLAAARVFRPALCRRWLSPKVTGPLGVAAWVCVILLCARVDGVVLDLTGAVVVYPLAAIGTALLLSMLLDVESALRRLPLAPVTAIATLAYSLYLVHKPMQHLLRAHLGDRALSGWSGLGLYLLADVGAAVLLWLAIERPGLKLRDRLLARPRP